MLLAYITNTMKMKISQLLKSKILKAQKNEITEHMIYERLALIASGSNRNVLKKISGEEVGHYNFFKKFTLEEAKPNKLKVAFYYLVSKFFGINFGLRLMEKEEKIAQEVYDELVKISPSVRKVIKEEKHHEERLLGMLDTQELAYTGSVILGLNDALVELTGALAGFTLALNKTMLIAAAGLITGIAASLSMAASEYLSAREEGSKNPFKSSTYTGIAYISVVLLLVLPYFTLKNPLMSLAASLLIAIIVILAFNFYIAVAKSLSFKKRFLEMAAISLGVAALSFLIGLLARKIVNVEI